MYKKTISYSKSDYSRDTVMSVIVYRIYAYSYNCTVITH